MNKVLLALTVFVSFSSHAVGCRVDINNEVHLSDKTVEIHQISGDVARFDESNQLFINDKAVALTAEQQADIAAFRDSLNQYLPKARQIASDTMELANDVLGDLAKSLDAPEAFDPAKEQVAGLIADLEKRYYKDGELVIPAETFDSINERWSKEWQRVQSLFNQEFVSGAFNALSNKMKQEGGINLSELSTQMAEVAKQLEQRLSEYNESLEKENKALCDSLDDAAEQEQNLLKTIPELKDYRVFTI